jgi:hypothetical protein
MFLGAGYHLGEQLFGVAAALEWKKVKTIFPDIIETDYPALFAGIAFM